jgi:hypothetical protein
MSMMKKWVLGNKDHCPSCLAAAGQIHPLHVWEAAGIKPKAQKLYCRQSCCCMLEDIETDKEAGDLSDIPVRGGKELGTGASLAAAPGDTNQAWLAVDGGVNAAGEFEIMAITAGEGNGWEWGAAALSESLSLWEGAECFVDHEWSRHSLRNLAGVLHGVSWDAASQGVKGKLKPVGPSSAMLSELGRQLLAEPGERKPRVGFSADILFTSQGRKVTKILRVLSVDLVFNPARGGAFLRALNSLEAQGVLQMDPEEEGKVGVAAVVQPAGSPVLQAQLQKDTEAIRSLMSQHQQQLELERQAEEARKTRVQMCGYLLDTGLAASKLPAPVVNKIRKQFAGKAFENEELTQAIEDNRALLAELSASNIIQGAGRISGMVSSEDQFTAAVHDLLGAERPEGLDKVKAARLSGIRELYTLMTGDYDFVGGYDATRAQFSVTTDLPGVLKNAMNKLIIAQWQELGRSGYRWWESIVKVEHFNNLQAITGVLMGEVTVLPVVAEAGAYTSLNVADSPETAAWVKYGGYVGLTLEMFERDETHKLKEIPKKLSSAGLRRISALVGAVFTSAAGVGPNLADGVALFAAGHGANLGVAALASASWEAASSCIYNQPLLVGAAGTAPKQALDAKYLVVPRALRLAGMQLLYPDMEHTVNIFSQNMQKGQMGDLIVCPEMSDANDWAAVADPALAPAIIVAERFGLLPEIIVADAAQNGALFTNDEIRLKARHFLSVFVADYRPLYKANVP